MKKILITLVILATFYLMGAAVEWNLNPAAWLRLTRFGILSGAGLFVLLYPFKTEKK